MHAAAAKDLLRSQLFVTPLQEIIFEFKIAEEA
jgi:hypothetical protein